MRNFEDGAVGQARKGSSISAGESGPRTPHIEFDPSSAEYVDDPFPIWRRAREEERVLYSEALGAWVITRHRLVQEILQDPDRFPSGGLDSPRTPPPEVMQILDEIETYVPPLRATDPPDHARRRRSIQAAVAPRRVHLMEDRVREICRELLGSLKAQKSFDFYDRFAYRYPLYVISDLLGFSRADAHRLHDWANCRVAMAWGNLATEEWRLAARGVVDFHRFIEDAVRSRQQSPRDDLLSEMVRANDGATESISFDELVEQAHGLITAGHETTANFLTMALYHLLSDRARWARLCADPASIPQVVEEALRFDGPVRALWRCSKSATTIGGVAIMAGDKLYCVTSSANRDGAVFEYPDDFVPGRRESRLLMTFGRGPHQCLGAALARMQACVAFEELARELPDIELGVDQLTFVENSTLRIPVALPLRRIAQERKS